MINIDLKRYFCVSAYKSLTIINNGFNNFEISLFVLVVHALMRDNKNMSVY